MKMITHTLIIVLFCVIVEINGDSRLFSNLHQDIAKKFDRESINGAEKPWTYLKTEFKETVKTNGDDRLFSNLHQEIAKTFDIEHKNDEKPWTHLKGKPDKETVKTNGDDRIFSNLHQEIAKKFDMEHKEDEKPWTHLKGKPNKRIVKTNGDDRPFSNLHQEIAKNFDMEHKEDEKPWTNLKAKLNREKGRRTFGLYRNYDEYVETVPLEPLQPTRREFTYNRYEGGSVVGVPSNEYHLPVAEPILPGHTLVRPTLGMLKSAVTFPHVDPDNGVGYSGVYGNPQTLGIRYAHRNGRILYTNFRRALSDNSGVLPSERHSSSRSPKSRFYLVPVALDKVKDDEVKNMIFNMLKHSSAHSTSRHRTVTGSNSVSTKPGYETGRKENVDKRASKLSSRQNEGKFFWKTKTLFDHIILEPNKPELSDLIPADPKKVPRNWWYLNEDDLSQLDA